MANRTGGHWLELIEYSIFLMVIHAMLMDTQTVRDF